MKYIAIVILLTGCGNGPFIPIILKGKSGDRGKDGVSIVGQRGEVGPSGNDGADGSDGSNGSNGVGCTVTTVSPGLSAPNGGALINCANGSVLVTNGATGSTGSQGPVGPSGPQGIPGTNATSVTPVKLCPDVVPSYPTVFPEYSLCIGSKLYAVYWHQGPNTAFLAELLPGSYTTTSLNNNCNFTVIANSCTVGH